MIIEELGRIGYGNLKFEFSCVKRVLDFFRERGVSSDSLLILSHAFYRAVSQKLDCDVNDEKVIEVVFYGVNLMDEGVEEFVSGYMNFENFPLQFEEQTFFVNFGARVK